MASSGGASVIDAEGDPTPSPIDPPPPWSDLLGARLSRSDAGFELRVRVAGGGAPSSSGSDGHTMNVASFYDVDGDGSIDYEVWANIAESGWGGSHFDNGAGTGAYLEDSGVAIRTDGDEVVITFPHAHLNDARSFRWSVASEWGRYEAIGTPSAVRDQAPDGGGGVEFVA